MFLLPSFFSHLTMFPSSMVGERAGICTLSGLTPTGHRQNKTVDIRDRSISTTCFILPPVHCRAHTFTLTPRGVFGVSKTGQRGQGSDSGIRPRSFYPLGFIPHQRSAGLNLLAELFQVKSHAEPPYSQVNISQAVRMSK